jgi:hypothetical protein
MWQGAADRGKSTTWGKLSEIYWWLPYGVMFRYGLSPLRAAASVFAIWVVAWVPVISSLAILTFSGIARRWEH